MSDFLSDLYLVKYSAGLNELSNLVMFAPKTMLQGSEEAEQERVWSRKWRPQSVKKKINSLRSTPITNES
jgi:hypothetical protein